MTKPITTFFFALVLVCNILSAQCNVNSPLQGLTIENATFLCGSELDGYSGSLPSGNSPSQFQPETLCEGFANGGGQADNIVWFSFIATSFSFDIDIFYSNCSGDMDQSLQIGIYGDTGFDEKMDCAYLAQSSPQNLSTNSAVPGQIYYLYLDGFDGATCDFEIRVNSGISTTPYIFELKDGVSAITTEENGTVVQDNANVCSGENILYTYEAPVCEASAGAFELENFNDLNLFCYEWTIDPPVGGVIVGDPNARVIEVDWEDEGDYTLSVEVFPLPQLNACSPDICTTISEIEITARPVMMESRDTIFFCAQDPPEFCGQTITESTTITCIPDNSNCQEVSQPFVLLENDTIDYGVFVNCGDNNCFNLFGLQYCIGGTYYLPDTGACNVFHKVIIEDVSVVIDLPTSMEIDCDDGNLSLAPAINTNYDGTIEFQWSNNDVVFSNQKDITITEVGSYSLEVIFPDLGDECNVTHTIVISESMSAPLYQINIPELNCYEPVGMIEFIPMDPVDGVLWQGPNGFTSNNTSITINEGGSYTLTVTGDNGCLNDTTFTVEESFDSPELELNVQDLNCINRITTASFSSDSEINEIQWTLGDGGIMNEDSLLIDAPGNYTLSVVGSNGCTTIQPFTITENLEMPVVDAGADQVWQCNTKSLTIEGSVSDGPNELSWSFVEKGDILTNASLSTIEVGSEGTYILNALNFESGCSTSDSMTIERNEDVPDSMEFVKVDPSCFDTQDGLIQVTNVEGGSEPYRYFLNGSQAADEFMSDLAAGVYTLMVLDEFDCQLSVEVEVEEKPEISLAQMPSEIVIGYNEVNTYFAQHNLSPEDLQNISWYDANGNLLAEGDSLVFKTDTDTELTIEVTNIEGCSVFRTIPVEVDFDLPVYAPNVFSPNDDGVNDFFTLYKRDDYPSQILELSIYNRWGEEVFSKKNLSFEDETEGWDGRKNGRVLDNAVFTYKAIVELVDGTEKQVNGEVAILK